MGRYRITIDGTGYHHNKKEYDADTMAKELVAKLKSNGHTIHRAEFDLTGSYTPPEDIVNG